MEDLNVHSGVLLLEFKEEVNAYAVVSIQSAICAFGEETRLEVRPGTTK